MKPLHRLAAGLFVIAFCGNALDAEERSVDPVSFDRLLNEMVDLGGLCEYPDPPFVTRQFSSYARASKSPDNPNTWFANGDRGKYLRTEKANGRTEYVMMDVKGPGAVVRLWSANPGGTLRFYLDGADEPAWTVSMKDAMTGDGPPGQPFGHEAARGFNLYFPVPYRAGCKVTSTEKGMYYHVTYREYAEGTAVESFDPKVLDEKAEAIAAAAAVLTDPSRALAVGGAAKADRASFDLRLTNDTKRAERTLRFDRPHVVRRLAIRPSTTDAEALRKTILSIAFDGVETVRTPLGDFFGSGPGVNPYESLPLSMKTDGTLICRWPMPARESMTIALIGDGRELSAAIAVQSVPYAWTDRTMLFHANWTSERDIPTMPRRDWTYIDLAGRGVYVGNCLNVANPVRRWWGEGDEKIYIDRETFPSTFGTGTEDYYGYAWCTPKVFHHAYHNQTRCDGPGNFGHTSNNRWHIVDRMPFNTAFRFDMEVWHQHKETTVSYAVVNYWYQRRNRLTPADAGIPELPGTEKRPGPRPTPKNAFKLEGAIEGESMTVVEKGGGQVRTQDMSPYRDGKWSGAEHLWWVNPKPGDTLTLSFDAPRAGRYRVLAHLTKAPDYGRFEVAMGDGEAVAVNLYAETVTNAAPVDLGAHDVATKGNRLTVTVTGIDPKAKPKRYLFGLDAIQLVKEND